MSEWHEKAMRDMRELAEALNNGGVWTREWGFGPFIDPDYDEHVAAWRQLFEQIQTEYPNAPNDAIVDRALTSVFQIQPEERFPDGE